MSIETDVNKFFDAYKPAGFWRRLWLELSDEKGVKLSNAFLYIREKLRGGIDLRGVVELCKFVVKATKIDTSTNADCLDTFAQSDTFKLGWVFYRYGLLEYNCSEEWFFRLSCIISINRLPQMLYLLDNFGYWNDIFFPDVDSGFTFVENLTRIEFEEESEITISNIKPYIEAFKDLKSYFKEEYHLTNMGYLLEIWVKFKHREATLAQDPLIREATVSHPYPVTMLKVVSKLSKFNFFQEERHDTMDWLQGISLGGLRELIALDTSKYPVDRSLLRIVSDLHRRLSKEHKTTHVLSDHSFLQAKNTPDKEYDAPVSSYNLNK